MTNIEDKINKDFKGALFSGQSIIDAVKKVIPVSPGLDLILGGGIPEGNRVILTGSFKVGKTLTALDFAATAQKKEYACDIGSPEGRHIYFFNVEGRLQKRDLEGINGLDYSPERFTVIGSQLGNILTGENYIDIAEQLINEKPGDIFIIDSYSAICTEGEMKANIGDRYRADAPLLLARFCRRLASVVPINNSIILGITHIIANQGPGMSQWSEASGRKVQYTCDVKLKAEYCKPWIVGDNQIGQDVYWKCEWNPLNAPRNGKFCSKIRYGYGIDKPAELVNLAVDLGLITKGGSWFTFEDGTKAQGLDKAANIIRDDEKLYSDLHLKIRNMMGF